MLGQRVGGNLRGDLAVMQHAQQAVGGDAADLDGVESPFAEDAKDFGFAAALGDQQHALLRFAEHHFVGRHAGFALRHAVELDLDAHAAARSHFAGGAGEAGGAHVLNADDGAGGHGFEARFEQQLFEEGIADLHVGTLLLRFLGEFGGGQQRSAVDAVAAGLGADVDDRIAFAAGAREEQLVLRRDAEGQHVDQRIAGVAGLEGDFAADRGHAEAIAVKSDAAHDAVEQAAIARDDFGRVAMRRRDGAEAQRIEHGDGPRAHGEDVAQNSADAGGRALEGLDVAGVIVRFHLEDGGEAVADVDHAGIFARALQHLRRARGQALQVHAAGFVGAVLAPHHAENAEFGEVGIAAENFLDARVLVGREAVLGDESAA